MFKKYPIEVQNEVLLSLIKKAENTEIGKNYEFKSIKDYKSFSKKVPITSYEEFYPKIKRSIEGEDNIFWGSEINGMHNLVGQQIQKASTFLLVKNHWKIVIIKLVKTFYVFT